MRFPPIWRSAKRWREWMELERRRKIMPVTGRIPRSKSSLPARFGGSDVNALSTFVKSVLGRASPARPSTWRRPFQDSAPERDVHLPVAGRGRRGGVESSVQAPLHGENGQYAAVSLGQGQEPIAMSWLTNFHKSGGWVLLQNIHLTIDWTNGPLEKRDARRRRARQFRLFLSAEPPPILERGLAISLLQNSIKLTNEPPEGMKQNWLAPTATSAEMLRRAPNKPGSRRLSSRCVTSRRHIGAQEVRRGEHTDAASRSGGT